MLAISFLLLIADPSDPAPSLPLPFAVTAAALPASAAPTCNPGGRPLLVDAETPTAFRLPPAISSAAVAFFFPVGPTAKLPRRFPEGLSTGAVGRSGLTLSAINRPRLTLSRSPWNSGGGGTTSVLPIFSSRGVAVCATCGAGPTTRTRPISIPRAARDVPVRRLGAGGTTETAPIFVSAVVHALCAGTTSCGAGATTGRESMYTSPRPRDISTPTVGAGATAAICGSSGSRRLACATTSGAGATTRCREIEAVRTPRAGTCGAGPTIC